MYKPLGKLKKELDSWFSKYIRLTYPERCFTCGKEDSWKNLQNGHFVRRNATAVRYEEDNCRPQCVGCNLYGEGKVLDFEENLVKELGRDRVEEIKQMRHLTVKRTPDWFVEQIEYYKERVRDLTLERQ